MIIDIDQLEKETKDNLTRNKLSLLCLFSFFSLIMLIFLWNAPPTTPEERVILLRIPNSSSDLLELIEVLKNYTANSYAYTLSAFCFVFLFFQSFGIPGPIILSTISGALFGRWTGLFLVTACSTVGSSMCYYLSYTMGKGLIVRWFPSYISIIHTKLQKHRAKLFYYLLFLRLAPVVPNWFINLSAPILGINKYVFVVATFFGLIPANILLIQSGMTLSDMQETGISSGGLMMLFGLGALALLPTVLAKKHDSSE